MATFPNFIQFSPPNPAAQTSTTGVMVGLGVGAPAFFAARTGAHQVTITGTMLPSAAATCTLQLNYGVNTAAPANNASPTGTPTTPPCVYTMGATTGYAVPFTVSIIVFYLPIGAPVWFDLVAKSSAGSLTLTNLNVTVLELGGG